MNTVFATGSDETDFPQELKETWKRFTSGVRKNVTSLGRTVTKRKTIKKLVVCVQARCDLSSVCLVGAR